MLLRPALAVLALALVAACGGVPEQPGFYRDLAQPGAQLDATAAASMISGYRANSNLPAVTVDPALMKIAQRQAEGMAARDRLDHTVTRDFVNRLRASGYDARSAAENISAGYHTIAEAFSGWRDSPPHRANMLLKGATRMGIAAVYTPASKYKVYWALILAEPEERSGSLDTSGVIVRASRRSVHTGSAVIAGLPAEACPAQGERARVDFSPRRQPCACS